MTIYREKLLPGPWIFIMTGLVIPAMLLVFLPINLTVGIVVAPLAYLICAAVLVATSPVLEVSAERVVAGRASIPVANVGEVRGYAGAEAREQRGPVLDARAWLVIRGWIDPVVTIEVLDDDDPVPYWLVSTRHPDAVVGAVEAARAATRA